MSVKYRLVVTTPGGKVRSYPVGDHPITVGRLPNSTICIDETPVSRQHCVIIPTGGGLTMLDRGSTNGTNINGFRRQHARLVHDDELKLGQTTIRIEAEPLHQESSLDGRPTSSKPMPTLGDPLQSDRQILYLSELAKRMTMAPKVSTAHQLLFEAVTDTFHVERVILLSVRSKPKQARLKVVASAGDQASAIPADVLNRALVRQAIASQKAEWIINPKKTGETHPWDTALCTPIWAEERIVGALYADAVVAPRLFEYDEVLCLFAAIGNLASLALRPPPARPTPAALLPDASGLSTETHQLIDQRVQLAERLAQMEHLEQARSNLSRGLVHDIKNLVGALHSNHSFIRETLDEDSDEMEAIDDAIEISKRIVTMAEDVLSLGRMEEGSFPLAAQQVDLHELLSRALRRHMSQARDQSINLSLGPIDPGFEALVDPAVVDRMLDNLLNNALRHASEQGWVVLSATGSEDWADLIVADSGPSIPPDERDQVFTKWYCSENAGLRHHGVGLYFCRVAAEAHGGRIRIEGGPGDNRFVITLPATSEEDASSKTAVIEKSRIERSDAS